MTALAKILVTFCLSLACCSCNFSFDSKGKFSWGGIKGKGEVVRIERNINENFNAVKASKGLDVILVKDQNKKVIVEANKNLHEHIEVYVKDNTLYVTSDKNIFRADEKNVVLPPKKL